MNAETENKPSAQIDTRILDNVDVTVEAVIGTSRMKVEAFRKLGEDDVLKLDREIDQLIDIRLNGQIIARGQLVTVENKFGVRISEIVNE